MSYEQKWIKFQPSNKSPKLWAAASRLAVYTVGLFSKLWLDGMNSLKAVNCEHLYKALEQRPPGLGLVTVANHHSCMDEPLIWGILKCRHLLNYDLMRWTLGAQDIIYITYRHSLFFSLGKTAPAHRGGGVYQRSMDFMLERLNSGQWVHTYPEGKVNMPKESATLRLKWGVGRLISECQKTPIVIPIYHLGMDDILPNYTYHPRTRKKVTVIVGSPLEFTEDVKRLKESCKTPREIRKFISDRIQEELHTLGALAQEVHSSR